VIDEANSARYETCRKTRTVRRGAVEAYACVKVSFLFFFVFFFFSIFPSPSRAPRARTEDGVLDVMSNGELHREGGIQSPMALYKKHE